MEFEKNRIGTFATYPRDATLSALKLAHVGFIYKYRSEEIECCFCKWHTTLFDISFDDIINDHTRMAPACQMVEGEARTNVKWTADPETTFEELLNKINFKPCMHKENCNEKARKESILGRIEIHGQSQAGRSGETQVETQSSHTIVQTESVPLNHQREITNQAFMTTVTPLNVSDPQAALTTNVTNKVEGARAKNGFGELRPVPSFSEFGVITKLPNWTDHAQKSRRTETSVLSTKDNPAIYEADFYYADKPMKTQSPNTNEQAQISKNHLKNSTTYSKVLNIQKESKELHEERLCKICWAKNVEVLFTPCGHLLSCAECAESLKSCPICRCDIKGKAGVILY